MRDEVRLLAERVEVVLRVMNERIAVPRGGSDPPQVRTGRPARRPRGICTKPLPRGLNTESRTACALRQMVQGGGAELLTP